MQNDLILTNSSKIQNTSNLDVTCKMVGSWEEIRDLLRQE